MGCVTGVDLHVTCSGKGATSLFNVYCDIENVPWPQAAEYK